MPLLILTKTPEQWITFWQHKARDNPENSGSLAFFSLCDGFCYEKVDESRYKTDKEFKDITDRRMAIQQRREKVKKGLEDFYSVKQGSDLSHLIPTELLRLINPDTELQFFLDFIDGKTLQYEVRGKEKKAKGPIIVCLDSSGSMDGTPEIVIDFCIRN